jgi:hypothetical protein
MQVCGHDLEGSMNDSPHSEHSITVLPDTIREP